MPLLDTKTQRAEIEAAASAAGIDTSPDRYGRSWFDYSGAADISHVDTGIILKNKTSGVQQFGSPYAAYTGMDIIKNQPSEGSKSVDLRVAGTDGTTAIASGPNESTLTPEQFYAKQAANAANVNDPSKPSVYTTYNPDRSIRYQGAGDVASVNAMGQTSEAALSAAAKASYVPPTSKDIQQGIQNIDPKGLTIPTTILQTGAKGDAVKALQDYLVKAGFMTQAQVNTGYGNYGPQTTAAVLALQKSLGMDYSSGPGQFGPKTIAALQAKNKVTPSTIPGAPTATGLGAGAGKPIDLGSIGGVGANGMYSSQSVVAGAEATQKSIADYMKLLAGDPSETQKRYDAILAQVEGLLPSQGGRGAAQAAEEARQGVDALKMALANVNGQIGVKMAQYKALSTQEEGKPITMNSIIGAQAQIQKAMASDIGLLQAQALGLQGQLEAAQEAADRAVDLKFADAKDALDLRMSQLQLLEGSLSKEEKNRADAINLYLQDKKDALAVQVANEKDKNSTLLNLLQKYPDADISINDSLEAASAKVKNSRIYAQETRLAGSTSSPTSPTPTTPTEPMPTYNPVKGGAKAGFAESETSPKGEWRFNWTTNKWESAIQPKATIATTPAQKAQQKAEVFQQMATAEWQNADPADQTAYIYSLGLNPSDFGL